MRTFTKTEAADKSLTWRSDDGQALVTVARDGEDWRVEVYEGDGFGPMAYIGSEGPFGYRSSAVPVARRWVRSLAKV
jgi:hypothetical protein